MPVESSLTLHPRSAWGTGLVGQQSVGSPVSRAPAAVRLLLAGVSGGILLLGSAPAWAERRVPVIEAQPPAKPAPAAAIAPATVPSQLASPPPAVSPSAPAQSAPAQPVPARINTGLVTIESDLQRADQATGVITATGNVRIVYPDQRVVATSRQAQYFSKEGRVVLSGAVDIVQEGGNLLRAEKVVYLVDSERLMAVPPEGQQVFSRMRINAVQPEVAPQAQAAPQAGATPPSNSPASGSLTPSGRPVFPLSPAIPPSSLPGGQP